MKIEKYIKEIGIDSEPIKTRIKELAVLSQEICPEKINDIFVSEYADNTGVRVLESLFFFSESYMIEVKNFRQEYNIDIVFFKENLDYMQMSLDNFDLLKANETSRLSIIIRIKLQLMAYLKASGLNCNYLKNIFVKYIKNNVTKLK